MKPTDNNSKDSLWETESKESIKEEITPSQRKIARWLLPLLLLGGGFALWQVFIPPSPPTAQTANNAPSSPPPRPVEVTTVTQGEATTQVKLLGQVEAGERATLRPQINGIVKEVLVKEGDRTTAGMTVAILDSADTMISLAQAQAKLAQEKSNLQRLQVGTRGEVIAQREAELLAAQAREREAEENLQSLINLQPSLIAQRQAELKSSKVREKEADDNLQRIKSLTSEGAIPERALVEAQSTLDTARSERLRAESSLRAQETQSNQEIANARTRLDSARGDRTRIQAVLTEAKAGFTPEEIAAQEGVVKAAEAMVKQAELALQRTEIKAPFSGVVQSKEVNAGDYVETNNPILTIVGDRTLDIFLEVSENLTGQVSMGMPVTLSARALPQWQEKTVITAVIPSTDTSSRRQLVRVSLDNPPPELLPGMAIQGDLVISGDVASGFIVPRDALTRRGDKWLVFAVKDNSAQQLEVEMIADMGQKVMISNPALYEGKTIVLKGGDGLQDQAPVKVVNS